MDLEEFEFLVFLRRISAADPPRRGTIKIKRDPHGNVTAQEVVATDDRDIQEIMFGKLPNAPTDTISRADEGVGADELRSEIAALRSDLNAIRVKHATLIEKMRAASGLLGDDK